MELKPQNPTTKGPADWFSGGDVFIDAIAQTHGETPASIAFVRFSPGARTAWHSHATGQSLLVTEGEARIQSRGEPVVSLRQGAIAFTPGGEWHWHGAAPDRFMTHLAISEGAAEWGEHVGDAEYGG